MSGPSSTNLSATLAESLNYELHEVETKSFPDGEKKIRINSLFLVLGRAVRNFRKCPNGMQEL